MFLVVLAPLLVAADKGDWSTDWSSWSHVDLNNHKTNHNLNHNHRENGDRFKKLRDKGSKERLSEEEIVWDVRKAEVGCVLFFLAPPSTAQPPLHVHVTHLPPRWV